MCSFERQLNCFQHHRKTIKIINYGTHKTEDVRTWLSAHANWTFHFTPTSSSWLNAVEGFFAKLTRRRLKVAILNSVAECEVAIGHFIAEHNRHEAKPFKRVPNDRFKPLK